MSIEPIGGYFSRDPGGGTGPPALRSTLAYASARCAMTAVFRAAKPRRVWVPHFVCEAVSDALAASGVASSRYNLSHDWSVPADVEIADDDLVLCVDYFGLCEEAIESLRQRFRRSQLFIDASQSLLCKQYDCAHIVYSPRKFFGAPDGGLLRSDISMPPRSPAEEHQSAQRCMHLDSRAQGLVGVGYQQFLRAEASLTDCEPRAMSLLTYEIIASVDVNTMEERRRSNYQFLVDCLVRMGLQVRQLPQCAVPLCCPVLCDKAAVYRRHLTDMGIFTPCYWPGIHLPNGDLEALKLRDKCIFLPCDQRYGIDYMQRVVNVFHELERRHEF